VTTSATASALVRRRLPLLAAVSLVLAAGASGAGPGAPAHEAAQSAGAQEGEHGDPAGENLIGREVLSADGETVGKVVDVEFSRLHAEEAARISLIGFLGTGEREILLPLSRLSLTPDGEVQTTFSSEQLESIPEVDQEFQQDDDEQ
jgi:hypothetical protein